MLADIEPFSVGSVSFSLDKSLSSGVEETVAEVIFYPRQNEVSLEFKDGLRQSQQYWTQAGRKQFIEALNTYKDDFANRKLVTSYGKSRAAYGKVPGRYQWKPLSFSSVYEASPAFELGYRFKGNTPYFSVHQKSAKEETGVNTGITTSPSFNLYFSRAQAEELANLFDQNFLLQSLGSMNAPPIEDSSKDVYIE